MFKIKDGFNLGVGVVLGAGFVNFVCRIALKALGVEVKKTTTEEPKDAE